MHTEPPAGIKRTGTSVRAELTGCSSRVIAFARAAGYRSITLWTNDVLAAARAIYATFGVTLVHAEPQPQFGADLVSETWELHFEASQ